MSAPDVENLQPIPRERSKCLDFFLLGSVITLFIMVLCGAALWFWMVKDLRADMGHFHPEKVSFLPSIGDSHYKAKNFAYLMPVSSELKNSTIHWMSKSYGNSDTIGSRYKYEPKQGALEMLRDGTYFLYTHLNISCISTCASGVITVSFEDERMNELLSCTLHLPKTPHDPIVEKCFTVIPHLPTASRMIAKMHAKVEPRAWKLDLNHSGFGVFLVEGPTDNEF